MRQSCSQNGLECPPTLQQQQDAMQTKMSSQSSSKQTSSRQTSTYHAPAGWEDGQIRDSDRSIESEWHPSCKFQSPFGLQEPLERKDSGHFAATPPESCTEDDLRYWPLPKLGSSRPQRTVRTKSKVLADIADEMSSRNSQMPRHTRQSSGDSMESLRRESRKRRAWHLKKACSAPGEDVRDALEALEANHVGSQSPCESGNWSQQTHAKEQQSPVQLQSRPEYVASRHRTPTRKRYSGRFRTSKFIGVGSSNRKTQWQARMVVQGKVTHLGYYATEEEAARVYDRVALSLNPSAQTNFPPSHYPKGNLAQFSGLTREDLQRALGVKPMDKSSRFRGVSRKKGRWEAKVMVNRKWAFRALFDSEDEAAHAYDAAVWRLKPQEATSFVNFKDGVSVRSLPPKSSRSHQDSQNLPSVKLEEDAMPPAAVTLTEMHIPQDEGPCYSAPEAITSETLRSQSIQLPIYGSGLAGVEPDVLPVISPLNQAPSLPMDLGLANQGLLAGQGSIPLSPQRSMCDQNGLPAFQPHTGLQHVPLLPDSDIADPHTLGVPPPTKRSSSPQQSLCDQKGLPTLPALPTLPVMNLPDPNSIGVPPPENLPFPALVAAGGAEMISTGGRLSQSLDSTPSQSLVNPELFSTQQAYAPSRAASSGLPPLPGCSSMGASEAPARYLSSKLTALTASTPRSSYAEGRPDAFAHNPFLQASASMPADACGLQAMTSLDRQASMIATASLDRQASMMATASLDRQASMRATASLDRKASMMATPSALGSLERQASLLPPAEHAARLHMSAAEGHKNSSLSQDLSYGVTNPELGAPAERRGSLSHINSLASINTAQFQQPSSQLGLPPHCGSPALGSTLYPATALPQPQTGILMDEAPAFNYAPVCNFANSRSASSSFLHSAATGSSHLLQASNGAPLRTSSGTCSSMPMLNASDVAAMGQTMSPLPRHLSHATSLETGFIAHREMMDSLQPTIAAPILEARTLNPEQADLLRNLDVDVELNDPVPISPVQIGGENMNVYSAHIMGDLG